ncbi:transposase [Nocardiopsis oceani]
MSERFGRRYPDPSGVWRMLDRLGLSSQTARWVSREVAGRAWLSAVHLPKYAPELNPVETLWAHIKDHLANRAFRSLEELEKVLRSRLRSVQQGPGLLLGFVRSVGPDPCPIPSITSSRISSIGGRRTAVAGIL